MTFHILQLYIDPPHQFNWQYPMAPYSESTTVCVSMELHDVRHAELWLIGTHVSLCKY